MAVRRANDGGAVVERCSPGGHGLVLTTPARRLYSRRVPLDPSRTVDELDELRALTGDDDGAQRVAWTSTWETARTWLRDKVQQAGAVETIDAAGNQWFTLPGRSERALLIGGHMDSVPNGGWLDGCLNVIAGLEVLRRIAEEGTPPLTVQARQLGGRGRCAIRPFAVRLVRRSGLDA